MSIEIFRDIFSLPPTRRLINSAIWNPRFVATYTWNWNTHEPYGTVAQELNNFDLLKPKSVQTSPTTEQRILYFFQLSIEVTQPLKHGSITSTCVLRQLAFRKVRLRDNVLLSCISVMTFEFLLFIFVLLLKYEDKTIKTKIIPILEHLIFKTAFFMVKNVEINNSIQFCCGVNLRVFCNSF